MPQQGAEPVTDRCALTGNQTHNPSVYGMVLQRSHTGQGWIIEELIQWTVFEVEFGILDNTEFQEQLEEIFY